MTSGVSFAQPRNSYAVKASKLSNEPKHNKRTLDIDKKIEDGKRFKKRLYEFQKAKYSYQHQDDDFNNRTSIPTSSGNFGEPRLSPLRRDRRLVKLHQKGLIPADHYNTNVGFATQSKIIERMSERKRQSLLSQLNKNSPNKMSKSPVVEKQSNKYAK